ncbi:helix-turn-helix domain-containing protein [Streptomyces sp. NPDC018833]|uniref:helix-turn-helix domain-containing protein n=1 Tax=Streptomyces sp. NPDC018833 TaxID=3365053 RepID=UPI00379E043E
MNLRKTAPGRPLVEERRKFLELVGQGVSIREASRIIGINRRTGQEWMNGRKPRIKTTVRTGK